MSREPTDPIALAPPLSALTAVAALSAMAINRIILPALSDRGRHGFWLQLDRAGDLLANVAAIAGIIALSSGLLSLLRGSQISLRRRLLIASFSGILLPSVVVATLLDRDRTTTQIVLFALGACHVLNVLISGNAARLAHTVLGRAVSLTLSGMAFVTLLAQVLQMLNQVRLEVWQANTYVWLRGGGEVAYLLALLLVAAWVMPRGSSRRDLVARALAAATLALAAVGFFVAQGALQSDYALVLYHAQRVSLFVDAAPLAYAIPLGAGLAASVGAFIASDGVRAQAGIGLSLLIAAGYAPHAPGRLLAMALAAVLISRAVMAAATRAKAAAAPVPSAQ